MRCPVESICWTPKILEEPIPLENVRFIIETNMNQLFGLEVEQTVKSFLIFKTQKIQHKFFRMNDSQSKSEILNILREYNTKFVYKIDPIADSFIRSRPSLLNHTQIVGVRNFGESVVRKPTLLCVDSTNVVIHQLSLSEWEWIPELEQDQKNTLLSTEEREKLKSMYEIKEVFALIQ